MDVLSLLLFRLLELLGKVAHGGKESGEPRLRRAWWWGKDNRRYGVPFPDG